MNKAKEAQVPRAVVQPPLEPIRATPSQVFKEAVFGELRRLEEARRDARRMPEHILYRELLGHLSDTLNALFQEGRIRVGNSINDKYIIPLTQKSINNNGNKENQTDDDNNSSREGAKE